MTKVYRLKRPMRKASRRLKLMGLDPKIIITANEGFVIIPLKQLVSLIDRKIANIPRGFKKAVYIESDSLVVHVEKVLE